MRLSGSLSRRCSEKAFFLFTVVGILIGDVRSGGRLSGAEKQGLLQSLQKILQPKNMGETGEKED
jgi:hypothetical protein